MRIPKPRATIALRLTLWYAVAFSVSAVLAMALVYSSVVGVLHAKTDSELLQDMEEAVSLVRKGGLAAFREELARDLAAPDSFTVFLRLWTTHGEPTAGAGFATADPAARAAVLEQLRRLAPTLRTVRIERLDDEVRVGYANTESGFILEFGQSLHEVQELLAALRNGIFIALPAIVLLSGPIGWFMARRALRGVQIVTQTAMEIADGAIERRVPVGSHGDELDRLALAFNGMLDRIEALIGGMREVTDNLAHDLRTPLARIRASAERAASRGAPDDERTTFAGTTTEECDRLLQILNSSLEIAEAQAGAAPLQLEDVDLSKVVEEARDLFVTLAEDAGIALAVDAPERCPVRADRSRVQRIVANLLDNAIKYTPAGGQVTMALSTEGRWARLDVRDTGMGVSAEGLPRIFERFYRGDGSRTGHGSGLGLSLARAFARAHGGDLTAVSTLGSGSELTLRLKRLV